VFNVVTSIADLFKFTDFDGAASAGPGPEFPSFSPTKLAAAIVPIADVVRQPNVIDFYSAGSGCGAREHAIQHAAVEHTVSY